jgi:hypothetical protein
MYHLLLFYLLNANHLSPADKAIKHQLMAKLALSKETTKGANDV